jgi:hypothetical protein
LADHTLYIDGKRIGSFVEESDALKFATISGKSHYVLYSYNSDGKQYRRIEGAVASLPSNPDLRSEFRPGYVAGNSQDLFVATVRRDGSVACVRTDKIAKPFCGDVTWVTKYDDHEVVAVSVVSPKEAILKATEFIKKRIDDAAKESMKNFK